MISEKELARLSYDGAPKIISGSIPAPKPRLIWRVPLTANPWPGAAENFPLSLQKAGVPP